MDQIRIGKFIAESRKSMNLTQRQLADALYFPLATKQFPNGSVEKDFPKFLSCYHCVRHWILLSMICFRVKRFPQLIIKRKRREI